LFNVQNGVKQKWGDCDMNARSQNSKRHLEVPDFYEALRKTALEKGADDAVTIPATDVIVDPRVRFKCMIPKCYMSGSCDHCPPNGHATAEVRKIVSGFDWGIFFRVKVKSSIIASKDLHEAVESGVFDKSGNLMNLGAHYALVFTIVKIIEKIARQSGSAATGFAAGNCKDPFCHLQPVCRNLMTDKGCRNPQLSSPSMESCGMDVYTMAARVGWDQYPIGGSCESESVPQGSLMGLVLLRKL
jgi:predicted metal-binding protein